MGPFTIRIPLLGHRNQGLCCIESRRFIIIYYHSINKFQVDKYIVLIKKKLSCCQIITKNRIILHEMSR